LPPSCEGSRASSETWHSDVSIILLLPHPVRHILSVPKRSSGPPTTPKLASDSVWRTSAVSSSWIRRVFPSAHRFSVRFSFFPACPPLVPPIEGHVFHGWGPDIYDEFRSYRSLFIFVTPVERPISATFLTRAFIPSAGDPFFFPLISLGPFNDPLPFRVFSNSLPINGPPPFKMALMFAFHRFFSTMSPEIVHKSYFPGRHHLQTFLVEPVLQFPLPSCSLVSVMLCDTVSAPAQPIGETPFDFL